jgi:hypothetical protein
MRSLTDRDKTAEYLGDGLYVVDDADVGIRLFATDGILVTNEVFLELDVLVAFLRFIKKQHPGIC